MLKKCIVIGLVILGLVGCETNITEIQSIEINIYENSEKNLKLAEDLIYYDPGYIATKVPGYTEEASHGIRLGYFVGNEGGNPKYRVTYSLKNLRTAKNLSALKKGFEDVIPVIAKEHASKEILFEELNLISVKWAKSLFHENGDLILQDGTEQIKTQITPEKLSEFSKGLVKEYGRDPRLTYVRSQYYKEYSGFSEVISTIYTAEFSNDKSASILITATKVGSEWRILGFRVEKTNA